MPQMKYEKHNARQYEQILRAARQLFVEKGIERVSFSAVADSCGIARATRTAGAVGGASAPGPGTLFRVF